MNKFVVCVVCLYEKEFVTRCLSHPQGPMHAWDCVGGESTEDEDAWEREIESLVVSCLPAIHTPK